MNSLFETLFDSAPDPMVVIDREGRIRHVNAQTLRMFGYVKDELAGKPTEILLPERFRFRHQRHRIDYFARPRVRPMGAGMELYGRRKDGTEFPVDIMLSPLETTEGVLALSVIRDVSERKRAEETLRQTTAMFERLFEFAPDGVIATSQTGEILRVNTQAEKMFGYSRDELLGKAIEVLLPDRFRRRHAGHRAIYFEQPRVRPMGVGLELYGRRKDGIEFPVDIVLSPIDTGSGTIVLSVVRDTTERKRFEELEKSRREMLLKEIHHRVKNNLQVVSSLLSLQSENIQDPRDMAMFQDTQTRIKSIALIHEKLYQSSNVTKLNFHDYLEDLTRDLIRSYGADSRGLRIALGIDPVQFAVETAIPCGLIVNELVSNALKHAYPTGSRGEVRVTLREAGPDAYTLRVADDGVGMPEGLDLENSHSLGLQIVQTLTAQLGGALRSEGPPGTAVEITFSSQAGG